MEERGREEEGGCTFEPLLHKVTYRVLGLYRLVMDSCRPCPSKFRDPLTSTFFCQLMLMRLVDRPYVGLQDGRFYRDQG